MSWQQIYSVMLTSFLRTPLLTNPCMREGGRERGRAGRCMKLHKKIFQKLLSTTEKIRFGKFVWYTFQALQRSYFTEYDPLISLSCSCIIIPNITTPYKGIGQEINWSPTTRHQSRTWPIHTESLPGQRHGGRNLLGIVVQGSRAQLWGNCPF